MDNSFGREISYIYMTSCFAYTCAHFRDWEREREIADIYFLVVSRELMHIYMCIWRYKAARARVHITLCVIEQTLKIIFQAARQLCFERLKIWLLSVQTYTSNWTSLLALCCIKGIIFFLKTSDYSRLRDSLFPFLWEKASFAIVINIVPFHLFLIHIISLILYFRVCKLRIQY